MKVILDGVFNHVGSDSVYFNRYGRYDSVGAYQDYHSPYRDWFTFHDDGSYAAWWGIELLPAVNKLNKQYRDYICGKDGVIAHWARKGVSGWRLDVVDELPDEFLDPLCEAMRRENGGVFITGEVWEDASHKIAYSVRRRYFLGGQLHSVTNYPLKNAIIAYVKDGDILRLARTMTDLCRNYPKNVLDSLMNIVGTHDTMRILTVLSGAALPDGKQAMSHFRLSADELALAKKRLKLAAALQFTLPGVPCVYYGDEAGMEGGADPFNRVCYPWGHEDSDLLDWYKHLSRIRRGNSCFKDGEYKLIEARNGLFAFTRGSDEQRILVAVNVSDSERTLTAPGFDYDLIKNEHIDLLTVEAGKTGIFRISSP
jgi:glycosidase